MSRGFNLPYKVNNPRTVRGAGRRGWHIIHVKNIPDDISWVGLNIWADRHARGYFVSSFNIRSFAFEDQADATFFSMKWSQ